MAACLQVHRWLRDFDLPAADAPDARITLGESAGVCVILRQRGRVLGMEPRGATTTVKALVPLGELSTYEADLRSATQGRASYSQRFSHYEELPVHLAERLIQQERQAQDE